MIGGIVMNEAVMRIGDQCRLSMDLIWSFNNTFDLTMYYNTISKERPQNINV